MFQERLKNYKGLTRTFLTFFIDLGLVSTEKKKKVREDIRNFRMMIARFFFIG